MRQRDIWETKIPFLSVEITKTPNDICTLQEVPLHRRGQGTARFLFTAVDKGQLDIRETKIPFLSVEITKTPNCIRTLQDVPIDRRGHETA
ncbi:hypothetical protein J6590_089926 [Homalodisca vitripennis]|nr:hypothetical protein J6590_089926 [Homalodisca vitripennis]